MHVPRLPVRRITTMNDKSSTPDSAKAERPKVTQREAVEQALAAAPFRSTGSIMLGGARLDYRVEGAFVPVAASALDERRGEPDAAVFTTAYLLARAPGDATPRPIC